MFIKALSLMILVLVGSAQASPPTALALLNKYRALAVCGPDKQGAYAILTKPRKTMNLEVRLDYQPRATIPVTAQRIDGTSGTFTRLTGENVRLDIGREGESVDFGYLDYDSYHTAFPCVVRK